MGTNRDEDERKRPIISPWLQRTLIAFLGLLVLFGICAGLFMYWVNGMQGHPTN
jgi:hypothetical protein